MMDQFFYSNNIFDEVIIITHRSILYATSGGQIGDKGMININIIHKTKFLFKKIHGHFIQTKEKLYIGKKIQIIQFLDPMIVMIKLIFVILQFI